MKFEAVSGFYGLAGYKFKYYPLLNDIKSSLYDLNPIK
jgi:hypothetical protein